MIYFRRLRNTCCVLLLMNILLWDHMLTQGLLSIPGLSPAVHILLRAILLLTAAIWYAVTELLPCYEKGLSFRLQVLSGGYELILSSFYALLLEIAGYLLFFSFHGKWIPSEMISLGNPFFRLLLLNGILAYLILLIHYLNGFWRTCFCSSQLGMWLRLLMFLFWWIPPVNIILFFKWCVIVRREIHQKRNQYLLDAARVENAVCQTRYPVVMVHGIFFRDWQYFNYWGRIPSQLKKNGANVYYGGQQSSRCIADSAAELKAEIENILQTTGAAKVNIVAHSKGGLDARYAISRLGMADKVASLTTINTPHRGCPFVDALLSAFPDWIVRFVAARYNALFRKLGDDAPDFLAGVRDLTAASCTAFNQTVPDSPQVYYQSSMSKMRSAKSAGFPLNLGYRLVKRQEGENDGLVSISSAVWGNYLGLLTAGKKGISHGDMIDLTRKTIRGFDVTEFYVQLFSSLKEKGF